MVRIRFPPAESQTKSAPQISLRSNFEQTRLRAGNTVYIAVEAPWGEIGAVAQRLIERDFTGKAVLHI